MVNGTSPTPCGGRWRIGPNSHVSNRPGHDGLTRGPRHGVASVPPRVLWFPPDRMRTAESSHYSSRVLERAVTLLGCFGIDAAELGLTELSSRTGLHKSTAYRILEVLRVNRFVEFNTETRQYHLGLRLFELGALAVSRLNLTTVAYPELERLVEQTGETAHLCVLDDTDVVYLAKVQSARALSMPSSVGRRNPAHCVGVGKAILAFLPRGRLDGFLTAVRYVRVTPRTLTSRGALLENLAATRRRGYAIDEGEFHDELWCVGAPVFDHSGDVVAGISVAGPWFRMSPALLPKLAEHVMAAARRISRQLGHRDSAAVAMPQPRTTVSIKQPRGRKVRPKSSASPSASVGRGSESPRRQRR